MSFIIGALLLASPFVYNRYKERKFARVLLKDYMAKGMTREQALSKVRGHGYWID